MRPRILVLPALWLGAVLLFPSFSSAQVSAVDSVRALIEAGRVDAAVAYAEAVEVKN